MRQIAGDLKRTGVVTAAHRALIGVGFAMGRTLEPPGFVGSAGIVHSSAEDFVGALAEYDIRIDRPAAVPQRLRPHAVVDAFAIALPQALGVEIESTVAILQRSIDRRSPALPLIVMDFWPIR